MKIIGNVFIPIIYIFIGIGWLAGFLIALIADVPNIIREVRVNLEKKNE